MNHAHPASASPARATASQRGATAVEFALVLPLLLLVLFAIVEFGLALYDKQLITNASGGAARAAIVYAAGGTTPAHPSTGQICTTATNTANGVMSLTGSASPTVTVYDDTAGTSTTCPSTSSTPLCASTGDEVTVAIAASFGGLLLGSSFNPLVSVSHNTLALTASTSALCQ